MNRPPEVGELVARVRRWRSSDAKRQDPNRKWMTLPFKTSCIREHASYCKCRATCKPQCKRQHRPEPLSARRGLKRFDQCSAVVSPRPTGSTKESTLGHSAGAASRRKNPKCPIDFMCTSAAAINQISACKFGNAANRRRMPFIVANESSRNPIASAEPCRVAYLAIIKRARLASRVVASGRKSGLRRAAHCIATSAGMSSPNRKAFAGK